MSQKWLSETLLCTEDGFDDEFRQNGRLNFNSFVIRIAFFSHSATLKQRKFHAVIAIAIDKR